MSGPERKDCAACYGEGVVWRYDFTDGFERNRGWDRCERCDGKGYEPERGREEEGAE